MKDIPRIIGKYSNRVNGPLLFISGGIHGNEPSGVTALQKVFKTLEKEQPQIKGTVVGVSGNRAALQKDKRYIDEDLNRVWTKENIAAGKKNSSEKKEMFEIIDVLEQFPEKNFSKRYFLDCHTTSSASEPYISVQEIHDNDGWAHKFPTYIIRGFSDIVRGCIDRYESMIGITGFVFEGGEHEAEISKKNHEGMIWLALQYACGLDLDTLTEFPEAAKMLLEKRKNRKTFEIIHRQGIKKDDTFKMEPGYSNFQPIKKGELLAHQNGKKMLSEWDAYIFMPLYQSQGNDGFFVVEQVK